MKHKENNFQVNKFSKRKHIENVDTSVVSKKQKITEEAPTTQLALEKSNRFAEVYAEIDEYGNTFLHDQLIRKTGNVSVSTYLSDHLHLLEIANNEGKKPLDLAIDIILSNIANGKNCNGTDLMVLLKSGAELTSENFCRLVSAMYPARLDILNIILKTIDRNNEEFFKKTFTGQFVNEVAAKLGIILIEVLFNFMAGSRIEKSADLLLRHQQLEEMQNVQPAILAIPGLMQDVELNRGLACHLAISTYGRNILSHQEVDENGNTVLHNQLIRKISALSLQTYLLDHIHALEVANDKGKKPIDIAIDMVLSDVANKRDYDVTNLTILLKYGAKLTADNFCYLVKGLYPERIDILNITLKTVNKTNKKFFEKTFTREFVNEVAAKLDIVLLKAMFEIMGENGIRSSDNLSHTHQKLRERQADQNQNIVYSQGNNDTDVSVNILDEEQDIVKVATQSSPVINPIFAQNSELNPQSTLQKKRKLNSKIFLSYDQIDKYGNTALHDRLVNKLSSKSFGNYVRDHVHLLEIANNQGKKPIDLAIDMVLSDVSNKKNSKESNLIVLLRFSAKLTPENFCRLVSATYPQQLEILNKVLIFFGKANKVFLNNTFTDDFVRQVTAKQNAVLSEVLTQITEGKKIGKSDDFLRKCQESERKQKDNYSKKIDENTDNERKNSPAPSQILDIVVETSIADVANLPRAKNLRFLPKITRVMVKSLENSK